MALRGTRIYVKEMIILSDFDLLIRGGTVVDGSGEPGRRADVAVQGGAIAAVGDLSRSAAARTIDAAGRTVTPGFIDPHAHSDLLLLADPRGQSKIQQGVTTELNGQCGMSPFPVHPEARAELASVVSFIGAPVEWTWTSADDYFARLAEARPAYSAGQLVGHSALRAWAMGFEDRPPTADEQAVMCDALRACMDAGCFGMSLGLGYALGSFAESDELLALLKVAAERRGLVSVHVRSEGAEVMEFITEISDLARGAGDGLRLQIDHLKCSGQRWWGRMERDAGADRGPARGRAGHRLRCLPRTPPAAGTSRARSRPGCTREAGRRCSSASPSPRLRAPAARASSPPGRRAPRPTTPSSWPSTASW